MKSLIIRSMGAAAVAVASLAATAATVTIDGVTQPDLSASYVEVTCTVRDKLADTAYEIELYSGTRCVATKEVESDTVTLVFPTTKKNLNLRADLYEGSLNDLDTTKPYLENKVYASSTLIRFHYPDSGRWRLWDVLFYDTDMNVTRRNESLRGKAVWYLTYSPSSNSEDDYRIEFTFTNDTEQTTAVWLYPQTGGTYGVDSDGKAAYHILAASASATAEVTCPLAIFLDDVAKSKTAEGMVDIVYTVSGMPGGAEYIVEVATTNAETGAVAFLDDLKHTVTADGTYVVRTAAPTETTRFFVRLTVEADETLNRLVSDNGDVTITVTAGAEGISGYWRGTCDIKEGAATTQLLRMEYTTSAGTALSVTAGKKTNVSTKNWPTVAVHAVQTIYEGSDWVLVFGNDDTGTDGMKTVTDRCKIDLKAQVVESATARLASASIAYDPEKAAEEEEKQSEEDDIGGKEGVDALKVVEIAKTATEGIWHVKVEPALKTDVDFLAWFVASDGRLKSKAASAIGLLDAVYAEAAEVADIDDEAKTVTLAVDVGEGCVEAGRAFIRIVAE